jgi:hypothetical protein
MKTDGHLGRCYLKGREGDAANVVLTAIGHNLRRVLSLAEGFAALNPACPMLGFRLALAPAFLADDHLDPLYRNGEYVSDTALGLDDARCVRVAFELAAQAKNLHVDAAVEDILVNAGRLQQMIATKQTA